MYTSIIFSTILIFFCINNVLTIHCPKSSAKWCQNKEIAQICGVTEQCKKFVWKIHDGNDKVNFTLYYETLCPDCRYFMTTQFSKTYQTIPNIINITIVPYGNAHETYDPTTKLYQFVCQHGADECLGNLIHTCVLNFYPTIEQYMPFVNCTESTSGDVKTVATQCAEKTKIDFNKIDACTKSTLGNQLQHMYAVQTESLQPPHKYVPWITVNGKHTEEMQHEAERDLIKLICKFYKGPNPPAECKQYL
ncbi:unnamed protein product [Rotaria sordida]|uniref:Saposin A-type domain-containing protein n=1 Tax=Rotaria sordida TaxID=392033 RepID=A0A815C205_9BILA|nr:unnamed protein product [Rotaria sordida]